MSVNHEFLQVVDFRGVSNEVAIIVELGFGPEPDKLQFVVGNVLLFGVHEGELVPPLCDREDNVLSKFF